MSISTYTVLQLDPYAGTDHSACGTFYSAESANYACKKLQKEADEEAREIDEGGGYGMYLHYIVEKDSPYQQELPMDMPLVTWHLHKVVAPEGDFYGLSLDANPSSSFIPFSSEELAKDWIERHGFHLF